MSPAFTEAFVSKCLQAGLSKAATAALLAHQSVIIAGEASPAFALGYEKVASIVQGGLAPRALPGFFLKQAIHVPAGTLRGGLQELFQGVKSVGRGLGAVGKGTIGRVMPPPGSTKSLIRKYPVSAFAAGVGGTAAGAYGLRHMFGGGDVGEAPYMPAGGYNPQESDKLREMHRDSIARGVYDVNREANQSSERRRVLQQAVDSHDVNSGKALQELTQMDQNAAIGQSKQQEYGERLTKDHGVMADKLKGLEAQRDSVRGQRHAWWRAPLRWTGIEDSGTYDRRELGAEDAASRAAENLRLNEHAHTLLNTGAVGQLPHSTPTPQTTNFFPTYDQ